MDRADSTQGVQPREKRDPIERFNTTLDDGRTVSFFVNKDSRLIVVDVVDADETGGVEILRYTAPEVR